MTKPVDDCTCQGGADQPEGAQLRANDCPIHGLTDDDDEDWPTDADWTDEDTAALDIGRKVMQAADLVKVAHSTALGAEAHWAFEMDDVRYDVRVTVAGKASE